MIVSQIIINFGCYKRPFRLISPLEFNPENPLNKFEINNSELSLSNIQIIYPKVILNSETENKIYLRENSRRDIYFINADKVNSSKGEPNDRIIVNTNELMSSTVENIDYFRYATNSIRLEDNSINIDYYGKF